MARKGFKKPTTTALADTSVNKMEQGITPYQNVPRAPDQEQGDLQLVVNNIIMRSVDRTPKDIGRMRTAHKMAEAIYYPNRTQLLDLYADVILDGHLSGLIDKRVKSVTNKRLRWVNNEVEDEELTRLSRSPKFRTMCREALLSIMYGHSGFEFIPGAAFDFKLIPRKHIKPERMVITTNQTDYDGLHYEGIDNIMVVGEQRDLGLLIKAAFYVLLKTGTFSDWANYIEIFGNPLIVTRYDSFDEKTKTQLAQAMDEIGSSMRVSIPKQAEIEIMDGKTSNANGDLQDKFVKACDNQLSILILGNTETTGNSNGGSLAKSKEQGKQQDEIVKDDTLFLLGILNSDKFKNILAAYGFNTSKGEWLIDESADEQELLVRSQVDEALIRMGLPLGDDYLYKTYNRPKPDNYEELKHEMEEAKEVAEEPQQQPGAGKKKPAAKGNAQRKADAAKSPENGKLSSWDKLRMKLADFFAHGHKG